MTEEVALSVLVVAKKFSVSESHIRNLIARGDLPAIRLGKRVLIPAPAVEALLSRPEAGR